jgi:hypothetical protein
MKLTRRQLAVSVPAILSRTALAIQPPTPGAGDELKAARERLKASSDALSSVAVSMSTEPAFEFKA